ncbi:unnamed protein product [Rotaria sordida]|uniref:Uncharacterized protein n=1 Tax=Rotaria sordida TaxID=392033 RepID=A0A818UBC1_9BILA|nr:unnamed protein product [Rotaria sordida]
MPIPLEKIQVIEDEIERLDYEDHNNKNLHTTITSSEQDFSFLNKSSHIKRSVYYDMKSITNHDYQPLRLSFEMEQSSIDYVFRRRYIAHWGLPEWLGDNHFLLQKHRQPANSIRECLISIEPLHSETINIWTHLIGTLCIAVTYILFLIDNYPQLDISDIISFSLFFISAILCLTFSTLLHIFINYSPRVLVTVSKLDYIATCALFYIGINILIFGSTVPVVHYLFYCYFQLKTIYISILFVLSIASMIGTSSAACSKPRYRPFKAILFIVLGLYGVAPATHACILYGLSRMFEMGFLYLCIMAVTYITGGIVYAIRIPERYFPGRFDVVGQSHQILHIAVIVAVYLHFYGICCLFHNITRTEQCITPITLKFSITDLSISS